MPRISRIEIRNGWAVARARCSQLRGSEDFPFAFMWAPWWRVAEGPWRSSMAATIPKNNDSCHQFRVVSARDEFEEGKSDGSTDLAVHAAHNHRVTLGRTACHCRH